MQCEKFESRLNQLLDERRKPELDDQLLAHACRCHGCRQMLDLQELLFDALAGAGLSDKSDTYVVSAAPPTDMADRVLHAIEPARPVGPLRVVRWLAFVAAAVVLIAAMPRAIQFIRPDVAPKIHPDTIASSGTSPAKSQDNPVVVVTPATSPEQSHDVVLSEDEQRYREWVNTWGESFGVGVMRFSSVDGRPVTEAIDAKVGQYVGFRPLRNSVTAAVVALRKTLPRIAQPRDDQAS